jgi:Uma2 family endonuclease
MVRQPPDQPAISLEQYLEFEATSPVRHEFVDGFLFAMAGASDPHNLICVNVSTQVRLAARGTPCRVYQSDMKLLVGQKAYYPDVLLTCHPDDAGQSAKQYPCFLVEVLSDSTEAIDRIEKFAQYRLLGNLQLYVLVHQTQRHLEYYRKQPSGEWLFGEIIGQGSLEFPCINLRLTLDEIYEDVDLPL